MGELFARPTSKDALSWTGERFTTNAQGEVEIEHLHRYFLAREMCRSLDVLDVASGEGYGAALLAQTAKSVLGVELSQKAVDHAQREYGAENLRFTQGDARCIPVPDASLDAVISFETLEHFYEHDLFFREVRRVLRPNGFLLVSTPDLNVYSSYATDPNPYHVHELTRQEFEAVLNKHFPAVAISGQRMLIGSVLGPTVLDAQQLLTFERRVNGNYESSRGVARAKYLLGVAALAKLPVIPASVFVESSFVEEMMRAFVDAPRLLKDSAEVRAALASAGNYARTLESALGDRDRALRDHNGLIEGALKDRDRALEQAQEDRIRAEAVSDHTQALQAEIAARDRAICEAQQQVSGLSVDLIHSHAHARTIKAALGLNEQGLSQARKLESDLRQAKMLADEKLQVAEALASEKEHRANHFIARFSETSLQLDETTRQLHDVSARLGDVLASRSWRLTRPLRKLGGRFPTLRRFVGRQLAEHPRLRMMARRGMKAVWWTLTGQLCERLQSRKALREKLALPATCPTHAPLLPALESAEPAVAALIAVDTVPLRLAPKPQLTLKELLVEEARQDLTTFLDSDERIELRSETVPLLSVLVIVWNAAYFTLKCLRALEAEMKVPGTPPFEVIVFDNASSDKTVQLLAKTDGLKVVSSPVNLGFLKGCNEGAMHASGEALLLLNSDAFVRPGALRSAWKCLKNEGDVGAVGGRLVLTTGQLQEAGSIIWSDGSTRGYCRGLGLEADEAMFTRDVAYCSGAFLLTPMRAWRALKGFDERYLPAYYEEVDYCLRLRECGLRVLYEPAVCVDHFEFGSEGKTGDALAQSIRNQKILRIRHATQLREFALPASEPNVLFARTWGRPRFGRLLVIDNEVPFAALGGGYPRARALVNAAADEGWDVTFFSMHEPHTDWVQVKSEFRHCIEFIVGRTAAHLAEFLQERCGYYDTAVVSRPDNMRLVANILVAFPHLLRSTKLIYDAEALVATRTALESAWNGRVVAPAALEDSISEEISVALHADAVICVNEQEAAHFRTHLDTPVLVLSHAVRPTAFVAPFDRRRGFVFVGRLLEKSAPNWIGLMWFIREVWPLIRKQMPSATLDVVGYVIADHRELMVGGVRVLGPVGDLSAVLDVARVFIAPVQFAAGIPIKIIEAAGAGLPVIATPLMAQQLEWSVPSEICTATTASAFADGAAALHENAAVWSAQSVAALARVTRENSEAAFDARVVDMLGHRRTAEMTVADTSPRVAQG